LLIYGLVRINPLVPTKNEDDRKKDLEN
jgi:hypothetical protein